jgi:multicomponent Na+:H+ antiporter subunit A
MMAALLLFHLLAGAAVLVLGDRLGRRALYLGGLAPLAALVWLTTQLPTVLDGGRVTESFSWVPGLGLAIDLRLDGFATLMALLITGIGVLVFLYGRWYFSADEPGLGRLVGLLTLFAGSMLGLVLADNLFVLYGFWELTSITSYLLIGNKYSDGRARSAALQALLTTGAGGLAMLGGFVLIGQEAGTYQLSAVLADPPEGTLVTAGLVLVLLGAVTKSAQYPFHYWLPGAMVAPTPVSAYLHSATMVKAGVYLVARFTPAFVDVPFWRPAVVTIGAVTMICGGLRALRQSDLKLLLAFGTVSQLGFMFVMFGMGTADAIVAGCALVLAHGLFKAALFMDVGILDHQLGTRDIGELPRLGREWRPFGVLLTVSAAAMAGIPLTLGFIAKEEDFAALADFSPFGGPALVAAVVVGSMLTFAYSARVVWGTFRLPVTRGAAAADPADRPSLAFLVAPIILAGLTLLFGVVPALLDSLLTAAGQALDGAVEAVHLALWHGFNNALWLSLLTFAVGGVLFVAHRPVSRLLAVGRHLPKAADAYLDTLRGLIWIADRTTGLVQSGSLPVYAGVILLTAVTLPGWALLTQTGPLELPPFVDEPVEVMLGAILLGSALGAAAVRRRFSAALFLGTVGYAMAGLFVVVGAPDLALTQTVIETLTLVLFVLVLRRLPDRFERRSGTLGRGLRVAIAGAVGAVVFFFALYAGADRVTPPVSDEMVERAYPEGHGRNVVNVILVDFRGLDTLGEVTVLVAAAIGAVAVARAGRRPDRADEGPSPSEGESKSTASTLELRHAPVATPTTSIPERR